MNIKDLIDINRLKTFWNEIKSKFAAASHTHTKSDITDFPSSLKNPNSLTMSKNGASYSYDGSSSAAVGAIYTPTAAGTAGYELISAGSGAPVWKQPSYAACSTAAGTVAKTASVSNFKLVPGVRVIIKFTYAHTATTAATLNISSTGAKTIYYFYGNQATKDYSWLAGEIVEFVYDGTYWRAIASNRFARRFADIENNIAGLSGSDVAAGTFSWSVNVAKGSTGTYTKTISTDKQCKIGIVRLRGTSVTAGKVIFATSDGCTDLTSYIITGVGTLSFSFNANSVVITNTVTVASNGSAVNATVNVDYMFL